MTLGQSLLLFGAAALAGGINSVAGGGSFISLPALIFVGVPPVRANATSTVALWPGMMASVVGYRREAAKSRALLLGLAGVSLLGGLAGALLLLWTSNTTFVRMLPWLLLLATALFTFSGRITRWLRARAGHETSRGMRIGSVAFQFVVAVYGGYFGGGMGIIVLAMLALLGMTDIHEMNAAKAVLAGTVNGIAVVTFVIAGAVEWVPGLIMIVGAVAGGFLGATFARRLDPAKVRVFVIAVGWAMAAYFFVKAYL